MESGNLLKQIPSAAAEEIIELVVRNKSLRIERIVSKGQVSPEDFWYDQDEGEFVVVLQGKAHLETLGSSDVIELEPGSFVDIPAHVKHRVAWTDPDQETVWLAIFY